MMTISTRGTRIVVTRTHELARVEQFKAQRLESSFEIDTGIDLRSPAGKALLKAFEKGLAARAKPAEEKQNASVTRVHEAVARILRTPSDTDAARARTLESEIETEIATWYNFSRNGLPREALKVLEAAAKALETRYGSEIDARKLAKSDPKLADNRKDVLKHVLGMLAGVAGLASGGGAVAGIASIVSNALKLARKSKELNDKLFKPNALNLARLAEMTSSAVDGLGEIEKHLALLDRLREKSRAAIAAQLAEVQALRREIASAERARATGDKNAVKRLKALSDQLARAERKAGELMDGLAETSDIAARVSQAARLMKEARALAVERAKSSREALKKADAIANDASIVADVAGSLTKAL